MSLRKRISLRNTLAFRLTLWYAGVFTVSSCVAFLLFYILITSFIRERTDQELLSQVNRFSTLLATEGVEAVKSAAVIEAQAAGIKKVFFRLLSLNGQVFPHPIYLIGEISTSVKRPSRSCFKVAAMCLRP